MKFLTIPKYDLNDRTENRNRVPFSLYSVGRIPSDAINHGTDCETVKCNSCTTITGSSTIYPRISPFLSQLSHHTPVDAGPATQMAPRLSDRRTKTEKGPTSFILFQSQRSPVVVKAKGNVYTIKFTIRYKVGDKEHIPGKVSSESGRGS